MSDNAGSACSAVGRVAMHGFEVKSTLSSRTWASFCVFSKFQCITSNSKQILLVSYPALSQTGNTK